MDLRFIPEEPDWKCYPCNKPLVQKKVEVRYLDSVFQVELPACPQCGRVMITEDLATGRMLEAEQLLEDK